MTACYIETARRGTLGERIALARAALSDCHLCPRACAVDRHRGETGTCELGAAAEVASSGPHFGEESPLVGRGGSGTIFFSSCNLRCVFCQNYEISQGIRGRALSGEELGGIMLGLQAEGCHNINLVTPSHQVPAILEGLSHAIAGGLNVPLVYNSSGYDSLATLRLLEGVVDIYMPDLKTVSSRCAKHYLRAPDYPDVARAALKEMHRQVGDLRVDAQGLATRGLLLRHLVMPGGLSATREVLHFVRNELSADTYINIMAQWHPAGECHRFAEVNQRVDPADYRNALAQAEELGLKRLDQRPRYRLAFRL